MWEVIAIMALFVVAWLAYEVRALRHAFDRRFAIASIISMWAATAHAQPKQKAPVALPLQKCRDDVHLAAVDAESLPAYDAKYTRYFTFSNTIVQTDQELRDALAVFTFHLWSIAHEPEPPQPRRVGPTLFAIRLDEFGIDRFVYGRLLFRDPYHHVALTRDGKKEDARASAPGMGDPADFLKLIECTGSQVPILRWDWFWIETSIQEGRGKAADGTGYYSFIGVTKRDDFFKLAGADPKKAAELYRRWRAIVKESGVAYNPRQIERFDSLGGGAWFTLDVLDEPVGNRNALRNLDGDFVHQAEEHYAIGPSGLPIYLACAADGTLQNSAPDRVGPDRTRPGNRTTIDCASSCIRCHSEILRPIDSWASEALKFPSTAELPYEKAIAAKRLYFRNLQSKLDQDRKAFTDRLYECNGLAPKVNASLYAKYWDKYTEDRLTITDAARELGTTTKRLEEVLLAVQAQKQLDPVLADFVTRPPGKIRRDMWHEIFPVVMIYLGGQP